MFMEKRLGSIRTQPSYFVSISKMVTIINGEIVQDSDPRAQAYRERNRRQEGQSYQQRNQQQPHMGQEPAARGGAGGVFEEINNRLLNAGFPRWNIGENVVEPFVSVALILALVFFGFRGVLLVGLVWFLLRQSQAR